MNRFLDFLDGLSARTIIKWLLILSTTFMYGAMFEYIRSHSAGHSTSYLAWDIIIGIVAVPIAVGWPFLFILAVEKSVLFLWGKLR